MTRLLPAVLRDGRWRDGGRVREVATATDQLGTVAFPTSCNAAAKPAILSGVAFMHSFQYQQSEEAFRQAAKADPRCAIARWGEAMALYQQLWNNADPETLAKGRAYLATAQKLNSGTALERGYIEAALAYFKDDPKLSYAERTRNYSEAMAKVHAANPNDTDAAAFYALSLVSLAYKDEKRSDADRKEALAILLPLFQTHPDHPGVAHYIIHAADTPALAPQGLEAARRYAKIAPDSSHALHMPSHIFVRLGLWQESVDSNLAASAAAAKATEAHQAAPHYQFHAMDYLAYSYAQMGQAAKADQVLADLKNVPGASAEEIGKRQAYLDARNALDLRRYKDAAALPVAECRNVRPCPYLLGEKHRRGTHRRRRRSPGRTSPSSSPPSRRATRTTRRMARRSKPASTQSSSKPKRGWRSPKSASTMLSPRCVPPPSARRANSLRTSSFPLAKCLVIYSSNLTARTLPSANTPPH